MWNDGLTQYLPGQGLLGHDPQMVGAFTGYFAEPAFGQPLVNEVYHAHVVVGIGTPPRGGVVLQTGVQLPPNTSFAPNPFQCFWEKVDTGEVFNSTGDPSAGCPSNPPGLLGNNVHDLGWRDLPQRSLFHIIFDLVTTSPLGLGSELLGYITCEYGNIVCGKTVQVFPETTQTQRNQPNRLNVRTYPSQISRTGVPISFTIVAEDSVTGDLLDGIADVHNFTPTGDERVLSIPTNTCIRHTFYYGKGEKGNVAVPWGVVTVPEYGEGTSIQIPFRFSRF